jgi:hypothetical protein
MNCGRYLVPMKCEGGIYSEVGVSEREREAFVMRKKYWKLQGCWCLANLC